MGVKPHPPIVRHYKLRKKIIRKKEISLDRIRLISNRKDKLKATAQTKLDIESPATSKYNAPPDLIETGPTLPEQWGLPTPSNKIKYPK